MGDGRYYTPEQFFNIILYTTLIIVVVIAYMLSLYKVERCKRYIRISGLLLLISLVSSFTFEVAYNTAIISFAKYLKTYLLLAYLLVNTIILFKDKHYKSYTTLAYLLLLFIPFLVITITKIKSNIIYPLYSLHFILISNKFTKYKVSSSVFSDVKKLMLDYVFIISINGDVIFKNDKTISSDIFKDIRLIDIDNISEMFTCETTIRSAFSKQFIKVNAGEVFYFQYHRKEIMDKGKLAGYIMTFVDITNLISMLDKLSENREQTQKTNLELDKYKDIVYDIEKEKEINNLLNEIARNQQKSMYLLKESLESLDIEGGSFLKDLDSISDKAKSDLSDVRAAVTSYIRYYDD